MNTSVAAKMKAPILPWWGWLLIAGAFISMGSDHLGITGKPLVVVADFAFTGLGIFLFVIGLARFVKWAWKDLA